MTISNRDSELSAKDQALFEERSKVAQLEYQQKKLVGLINKLPKELQDELFNGKKTKGREER